MPENYTQLFGFDPFDPVTMLQMVNQVKPPQTFILDKFFANRQTFNSSYVTIDFKRGQRRLAPVGHRLSPGKPSQRIQFANRLYEPPLSNPQRILTWLDGLVRNPGESPFEKRSVAERIAEKLAEDMIELNDMHIRRENKQACDALVNGSITLEGDGFKDVLDLQHSLTTTLTTSARWSETTAVPMTDIKNWALEVKRISGKTVRNLIIGTDVVMNFLGNAEVQKYTNILTTRLLTVDVQEPDNGAALLGIYNVPGIGKVNVWTYADWYLDETDLDEDGNAIEKPVFPGNAVVLIPDDFDGRLLCATYVDMVKLGNGAPYRYPRVWGDENGNKLFFELDALTLPVPADVDAWYSAIVQDAA